MKQFTIILAILMSSCFHAPSDANSQMLSANSSMETRESDTSKNITVRCKPESGDSCDRGRNL